MRPLQTSDKLQLVAERNEGEIEREIFKWKTNLAKLALAARQVSRGNFRSHLVWLKFLLEWQKRVLLCHWTKRYANERRRYETAKYSSHIPRAMFAKRARVCVWIAMVKFTSAKCNYNMYWSLPAIAKASRTQCFTALGRRRHNFMTSNIRICMQIQVSESVVWVPGETLHFTLFK